MYRIPRFVQWLDDVIQDLMFAVYILRVLAIPPFTVQDACHNSESHVFMWRCPNEKKGMGGMERKGVFLQPPLILAGSRISPSTPPAAFSSHLIELNLFTCPPSPHHWQRGRGLMCLACKPTMSQLLQLDIMLPK